MNNIYIFPKRICVLYDTRNGPDLHLNPDLINVECINKSYLQNGSLKSTLAVCVLLMYDCGYCKRIQHFALSLLYIILSKIL